MNLIKSNQSYFLSPVQILLVLGSLCLMNHAKADDTEVFYSQGIKNNNVLFVMDNSGSMTEKVPGTSADGRTSIVSRAIAVESDDAEEPTTGTELTNISSGDLELGYDYSIPQRVGLRFVNITIPKDSTIVSAYIQFKADSDSVDESSNTSTLDIKIQSIDNAPTFINDVARDIGDRSLYSNIVEWNPDAWNNASEQDDKQKTPDLKTLVQEVISRSGWSEGNSIAFVITGLGKRSAQSYKNNDGQDAPVLSIEYETEGEKTRMQVMQDALATVLQNAPDNLSVGILNYGDTTGARENLPNGVKFPITQIDSLARPIIETAMTIDGTPRWDLSNIPEPIGDITVRSFLSEVIADWQPKGFTPIVDSLYEAARYFRGEKVHFGDGLAKKALKYPAHPSTYEGAPVISESVEGSCNGTPNIIKIWGLDDIEEWDSATNTDGYVCPSDRDNPSGPGTAENCVLTKHDCDLTKRTCESGWVNQIKGECTGEPDEGGNPTDCEVTPGYCPDDDGDGEADWGPEGSHGYCTYATCEDAEEPNPNYITPMTDGCQSNFMILMSDGSPEYSGDVKPTAYDDMKTMIGGASCGEDDGTPFGFKAGYCGSELTHYLAATDNNTSIEGDQFINTYVIGFSEGISDDAEGYLKSLVTIDDVTTTDQREGYFSATSEAELANAFAKTLEAISAETRSQASPGYSVNVKSGLEHDEAIYIPVFDRGSGSIWSGNLKKFKLVDEGSSRYIRGKSEAGDYIDAMTELGFFKDTAWDEWSNSTEADGDVVAKGGAASLINEPNERKLYSNLTGDTDVDIFSSANQIKSSNLGDDAATDITHADLFDVEASGLTEDEEKTAYSEKLIEFIRGWQSGIPSTEDEPDLGTPRLHMGDMLHSEPIVFTYENETVISETETSAKVQYIFAATNEGYLHAFDAATGEEKYAFMPKELFKNIEGQYKGTGEHAYGIDGNISYWHKDEGVKGVVDGTDHVYLYFGLRRGGRSYYALDVTIPESPVLKWVINNEDSGFNRLGQSWSLPYLAKVLDSSGTEKAAVIFTGGNDPVFDYDVDYEPSQVTIDKSASMTMGDDIFIVDADDGTKLWSLEGTLGDVINHAIPGGARILDVNQNGFLDRIYFADTGGNVWRLDLLAEKLTNDSDDFELTKLAALGGTSTAARKFYNEPDVSSMKAGGKTIFGVAIGSGIRPHPMNEIIEDHMFVLLDESPLTKISVAYPDGYTEITMGNDLLEEVEIDAIEDEDDGTITKSVTQSTEFEGKKITQIDKRGWYVKFKEDGEKVLATSITFEGSLTFTTLVPESEVVEEVEGGCGSSSASSQGRIYSMNILTGEASLNIDENTVIDDQDIFKPISQGEIPGTPQRIFNSLECTDGECSHIVDIRIGKKSSEVGQEDVSEIESIYWSDPNN